MTDNKRGNADNGREGWKGRRKPGRESGWRLKTGKEEYVLKERKNSEKKT